MQLHKCSWHNYAQDKYGNAAIIQIWSCRLTKQVCACWQCSYERSVRGRQEQIDGASVGSASTPTSIRGQDSDDDSTDLRLLEVAYSVAYSTAGSCLYRSPSISLSSILGGGGKRELMGTGRAGRVLLSGNCDEYFTQPARSYFADKMPPRGFMHEGGGDLEGLMVKRGREQEKGCWWETFEGKWILNVFSCWACESLFG